MAIITDIKNAIRDRLHGKDSEVHFSFNEMKTTNFPYVFFYIPSFRLDKAVDEYNYSKLDLVCVLEYEKEDGTKAVDLWEYADILADVLKVIPYYNESFTPRNQEYKLVENVLQVTFDVTVYVKTEDLTDLMQELEFTFR